MTLSRTDFSPGQSDKDTRSAAKKTASEPENTLRGRENFKNPFIFADNLPFRLFMAEVLRACAPYATLTPSWKIIDLTKCS